MAHQVDVFWVSINSVTSTQLESSAQVLDDGEAATYQRYETDFKRVEFLVGRMLAKVLVAQKLGKSPCDIAFKKNIYGKPYLPNDRLFFNLSHTQGMVVCALSDHWMTGVDVERIRKYDSSIMDVAFAPCEIRAIQEQPSGQLIDEMFYRTWTRKEALVKALGKGFSIPPLSFCVPLEEGWAYTKDAIYYTFSPVDGYLASIVTCCMSSAVNVRQVPLQVLEHRISHLFPQPPLT